MAQELSNSFLTNPEKAYQAYLENGYHIESNVLTVAECNMLIAASKQLENAVCGNYRPQMMPHRQNSLYLLAMKNPLIIEIMRQILGGTPVGLQTEYFYCKPGTRGFSLHQDNFFVEAPYGAFGSAWVALTNTHLEKGGLIVYPGSHKEGSLPVKKLSSNKDMAQDPNANNEETIVPPKYKIMHAPVPRGAALFIHGHLVHGSNPNATMEWRHVLLNTFIRKGEYFRPGNYAQREAIDLCQRA
ncbi:MAG: hypothetical protein A3E84_02525 [Gammaproteobacteria bacterium RIFCSPHIGHO2_12_FULL_42_13]|nr:MAG: hypothetical protein A3E84_02525 [Gammaproteobacteria bacterium RIFCSPHIGHO2_12_FULL_42_13]